MLTHFNLFSWHIVSFLLAPELNCSSWKENAKAHNKVANKSITACSRIGDLGTSHTLSCLWHSVDNGPVIIGAQRWYVGGRCTFAAITQSRTANKLGWFVQSFSKLVLISCLISIKSILCCDQTAFLYTVCLYKEHILKRVKI